MANCEDDADQVQMLVDRDDRALTPNELAARYGVGVHKVLRWIKSGELVAVNVASDLRKRPQWVITADALRMFEKGRQSQSTPRAERRRKKSKEGVIEFY